MELIPGDIVRIKATKQEGIVGSVDGDDVLVMTKYTRTWLPVDAVAQPVGGGNIPARDTKAWLDAR